MFRTTWVHLGPFGSLTKLGATIPFGCLTKRGAKLAELEQKFVPRNRVGIFRNERTRCTPWTLSRHFGSFQTIWLHSGPFGCLTKLGATRAELVQNFVP